MIFILNLVEFLLLSNFLIIIILRHKNLTRKLGMLILIVGLLWLLVLTLKLEPQSILVLRAVSGNFIWGLFGVDRLSAFFGIITFFLTLVCVSLYNSRNYNQMLYLAIFFSLEILLFHIFNALNMLTFYVLFESTLLPMVLLILFWGSRQRKLHAMYMFFFYTIFGSILLLLGLLIFFFLSGSMIESFVNRIELVVLESFTIWMWFLLFLGFGFKVPIVPVHNWLPEAHVEAPTVGSIILAGLLLKVGTFGMLRFMFPVLNQLNYKYQIFVYAISIFSLYYASLAAIRQIDMKKIVAYSSIAHMSFVLLGMFSMTFFGFVGAYFTMLSHGIVAPALFFLVGVIYDRYGTRILMNYGGLVSLMPLYASFFFLLTLANIGFPSTSNFIGELLILIGVTSSNIFVGLLTTFSIILSPIYSLWMFNRLFFGELSNVLVGFFDLTNLEFIVSFIFLFLVLMGGVTPNFITSNTELEFTKYVVI